MKARLTIALLTLLFAGCDCGYVRLSRECPTICYDGPRDTTNIGACRSGKPVCDKDFNVIACDGQVLPRQRVCADTEDVACDHFAAPPIDDTIGRTCGSNTGACEPGTIQCVDHKLQCTGGIQPQPVDDCSGRDVDCDGIVNDPPPKVCYSGDPGDLVIPGTLCRAGVETCPAGVCVGEVLPKPIPPTDVVILMIRDWNVITQGYTGNGYPWDDWRRGLEVAARTDVSDAFRYGFYTIGANSEDPASLATIPMTDGLTFAAQVAQLSTTLEPEEDVSTNVYDIATNAMGWNFRPGARRFILMFADDNDEDSEDRALPGAHTSSQALDALSMNGFRLYSFSDPVESYHYAPWAILSGGAQLGIPWNAMTVTSEVLKILGPKDGCDPGP